MQRRIEIGSRNPWFKGLYALYAYLGIWAYCLVLSLATSSVKKIES